MRRIAQILAGLLLLVAAESSSATVVYDNGSPSPSSGNEMTEWIQTESFTLASDQTITDVRFWSFEPKPGYAGSISWLFYDDNAGKPGSVRVSGSASGVTRSMISPANMENDFSVGSLTLGPGTYWLGLHNGPLSRTTRAEVYWAARDFNGTPTGHEDHTPFGDSEWLDNGQEHAFVLYDRRDSGGPSDVPSPAAALLLAAGIVGTLSLRLPR